MKGLKGECKERKIGAKNSERHTTNSRKQQKTESMGSIGSMENIPIVEKMEYVGSVGNGESMEEMECGKRRKCGDVGENSGKAG